MAERQALEEVTAQIAAELKHLREEELPKLVTQDQAVTLAGKVRRRLRQWTFAALLALVAVLGIVFLLRHQDHRSIQRQARSDRAQLLAGCARGNDQRATLRAIIETAVNVQPPPPGLSPELQDLYRQSIARTEKLRADLLALPGVEPVDCALAFPVSPASPISSVKEKT